MNFFAHAQHCLDQPYELAGAAVPDWLTVLRPQRLRCRTRHAEPLLTDLDPRAADLAWGVVRHHDDDRWFHQTRAFAELSLEFSRRIRVATGDADGMRPSFVGHILVELLLDAELSVRNPAGLDQYYRSVESLDPNLIVDVVSRMTGRDASRLAAVIQRFLELRFLYDYAADEPLLFRLNQVMHRVRLPALPAGFAMLLPEARSDVRRLTDALMTPLAVSLSSNAPAASSA